MSSKRPVLPPPPADPKGDSATKESTREDSGKGKGGRSWLRSSKSESGATESATKADRKPDKPGNTGAMKSKSGAVRAVPTTKAVPSAARTRTAHLRLTRIDPLSVMKMTFLLSIALGIVLVVAVTIIWSVLSAVGVWDNVNAAVQQVIGTEQGETFDVSEYIGTPRVIGFSLIASVLNVVLLTAIATLSAFVYNLAAALLGGVEMTWAEDR